MAATVETVETQLANVENKLSEAPTKLREVSLALRTCYTTKAPSVKEFTKFRDSTVDSALVFNDALLPLSEQLVKDMYGFFDNYLVLTFDQWKAELKDIKNDAAEYRDLCDFLCCAYQSLAGELKKHEDQAKEVTEKFRLEAQKLEDEARRLSGKANFKQGCSSAVLFVFAPAALPLWYSEYCDVEGAKEATSEKKKAVLGTQFMTDVMIPALYGFAEAMDIMAGFFTVLTTEVQTFQGVRSKAIDDSTLRHYKLLNAKAQRIQSACNGFIRIAPGVKTDLGTIPHGSKMNYAQDWLQSTKMPDGRSIHAAISGSASCKSKLQALGL